MDYTNFLHRDVITPSVTDPVVHEVPKLPARFPKVYLIVVALLLVLTIGSLGYILALSSRRSSSSKQVTTSNPLSDSEGFAGQQGGNEANIALETKMKEIESQAGGNIYTNAIGMAQDTKRKADLTALAITLNIYLTENEKLPDNFPDQPRCIGTDQECFDLYALVVPMYLKEPFMDPTRGTVGNTKYLIGQSHDGITSFVAQATSQTGEKIEVKK